MKPSFSYPTHSGRTNPATRPGKHPARRYCLPAVLLTLVMMICAAGPATTFAQSVIYVNDDAPGANNGSSWADAYTSLQDALGAAGSGDQIWVAEGIYIPVTPADPGNVTEGEREATFQLVDGVEIYGGFGLNDEDELIGRNVETNLTILSGDIEGNDTTTDGVVTDPDDISGLNSYHVVTTGDGITLTTRLDGFTITGGSADPGDGTINNYGGGMINFGDPTLTGVTFSGNRANLGGGMANEDGSPTLTGVTFSGNEALSGGGMFDRGSPTLTNVTFSGNRAENGGGMHNRSGSPTLTGVTFSGNQASMHGGGMVNFSRGSPTLTNVTFSGNRAASLGGGMFNFHGSLTLINVSITGNSADTNGGGIHNFSGNGELVNVTIAGNSPNAMVVADGFTSWRNTIVYGRVDGDNFNASNSLIKGNSSTANGNIDATGLAAADIFSDPGGDDYSLLASSPAINAGSNQAYINAGGDPDNDTDLAGSPRVQHGTVDIGAFEFQGTPQTPVILTLDEGWRMLSSPIDGLTYSQMLEPLWTQGVPGTDHEGDESTFPNVYTWNTGYDGDCIEEYDNNQDCNGWQIPSSTDFEDAIPAGTGFLVYVFTDDDYDGDPEGFEKNLTLTGANHSGEISPPMNTIPEGWTLVGNPYRLPVAFDALDKTGLTDIAYLYDPNATGIDPPGPVNGNGGAWRSTDGTYGDITNGAIAPGQGFFVQNSGSAGSLTFTEESTTGGGDFYGKEKELRDFVRLEVKGESLYNSTWIRFSSEGSLERTAGEALELQPLSTHYAMMGARKADGTLMDIAHYPLKTQELEIPLAVEATRSGTFTITATDLDLPAGMTLYLYDTQTDQSMPIGEDFEYHFDLDVEEAMKNSPLERGKALNNSKADCTERGVCPSVPQPIQLSDGSPMKTVATGTDRFLITTHPGRPAGELPDEVALGQNYPNPFNPATVIRYQLPQQSQVRLQVYDMLGRRVATLVDEQVAAGRHQVSFNAGDLSSGVYLYRLQTGSHIITKKLTLIK